MKIRVCVPWRDGDLGRAEGHAVTSAFWRQFGWEYVEADSAEGPFNRAQARNRAAEGDWDIAIFADACILPNRAAVRRAIGHVIATRELTHAHSRVLRLTRTGTERLVAGWHLRRDDVLRQTGRATPGGVFAITRQLFEAVGGWHEGFIGWGGEDTAFIRAVTRLYRRANIASTAYHLWHLHSDRMIGSVAHRHNRELARRLSEA